MGLEHLTDNQARFNCHCGSTELQHYRSYTYVTVVKYTGRARENVSSHSRSLFLSLLVVTLQLSEQPQRLPDGSWNCSVYYWPKFQQHFLCNLLPECHNGEDEKDCVFTGCNGDTVRHTPGEDRQVVDEEQRFTASGNCYIYVRPQHKVTWIEAYTGCVMRGGARLASFNTPEEWDDVTGVLRMGKMSHKVIVGLKSSSSRLPQM